MIGIVIVSHSAKLAEGVCDLVAQMAHGQVPVATAGGLEGDAAVLGTDPLRVQQAIESVDSGDGALVLMDMGSALLSAEMAVELLPEAQRGRVHLCEAPLVEGAIAAAVQIAAGSPIEQVIAEARAALTAKAAQLPQTTSPPLPSPSMVSAAPASERLVAVLNRLGLHARPAALLVKTASRFEARIALHNIALGLGPADARSINQVMALGARQGHQVRLSAQGADADQAVAAVAALFESGFDELEAAPPAEGKLPAAAPGAADLRGVPISSGIAMGRLAHYHAPLPDVVRQQTNQPEGEWQRLQIAIRAAHQEVEALRQRTTARAGEDDASILDAHLLFLDDPALNDLARAGIFNAGLNAEAAWQDAVNQSTAALNALEDRYLRARAIDVADVGKRVLRQLTGAAVPHLELSEPAILIAGALSPSEVAGFDPMRVLGLCADFGSPLSHSAILARALGIPAVMGVEAQLSRLAEGTPVALDGQQGIAWVMPEGEALADLQRRRHAWLAARQRAQAASQRPAHTGDGRRVEVVANIGSLADARLALANGAEGVGVLRTEFLFLNRLAAPSEEEQYAAYDAIAQLLETRPFIIRTLDIGGDKPLPYLAQEHEANPFLGWRGIRISLARPDLLKTQLRAILRASPGRRLKVMFPMVSSLAEVRAARAILVEAQAELRQAGLSFDDDLELGIMVEVPTCIVVADQLAAEAQFFSIGSNDLSQYLTAADRTNPRVAALADGLQPAVLRLIHQVVQAGHAAGIWAGLCGELASDPLAVPLLVGMGLDELSANPAAIPAVKEAIARITMPEAEALLAAALALDSAEAVRACVQANLG
jgi:phosphoenolpyruvate-protein phosphotransferase/dihydroxyacetone kinase phosphotransfer subunit